MDNRKQVSHARSTWDKVKQFQEGIDKISKRINLKDVRKYLIDGTKLLGIAPSIYEEVDRLKQIRKEGIQGEMKYCIAQAKQNNIELTPNIISGEDIRPFFSEEVLEKVPSLDLYSHFMWYTEEELEKYKHYIKNSNEENLDNALNGGLKKENDDGER